MRIGKTGQIKINALVNNLIFAWIFIFLFLWKGEEGLVLVTLIFWMPLVSIRVLALGFVMSRLKTMKLRKAKMVLGTALLIYWMIFVLLLYLFQPVLFLWKLESYYLSRIVGYTVLILAWFFYLWAIYTAGWERVMRIQELSESKSQEDSKLIVTGPYSIVRHPIYFFELFIILGVFLITGIMSVLFLFVICMVVVFPIVYLEEKELRERFGWDYDSYAKKVGRLFPKVVSRGRS